MGGLLVRAKPLYFLLTRVLVTILLGGLLLGAQPLEHGAAGEGAHKHLEEGLVRGRGRVRVRVRVRVRLRRRLRLRVRVRARVKVRLRLRRRLKLRHLDALGGGRRLAVLLRQRPGGRRAG